MYVGRRLDTPMSEITHPLLREREREGDTISVLQECWLFPILRIAQKVFINASTHKDL